MAGYWIASDLAQFVVQPVLGSVLITGSSNPINLVEFQRIIDMKSAEFDMAAAKAGYSVPIPSTASAYVAVQSIVRNGATADVLRVVYTGPDQKYVDRFETAFQVALKVIEQGDRPLPGAPADPAADGRLFAQFSGIASPVLNPTIGYPQDLGPVTDF